MSETMEIYLAELAPIIAGTIIVLFFVISFRVMQ